MTIGRRVATAAAALSLLLAHDAEPQVTGMRILDDLLIVSTVQATADGGLFAVGSAAVGANLVAMKLDAAGLVEWSRRYPDTSLPGRFGSAGIATTDGGYLLTGGSRLSGGGNAVLIKLASDGTVVWRRGYGGAEVHFAYSVLETSDGGFVVAGQSESFGSLYYRAWVFKTTADGDLAWQLTADALYTDYAGEIAETADGDLVVIGARDLGLVTMHTTVSRYTAGGAPEWQRVYETAGGSLGRDVLATNDGGLITLSHGPSLTWVMKLDGAGEVVWERQYDTLFGDIDADAGGFVLAGNGGDPDLDVRVMKIDSRGDPIWTVALDEGGWERGTTLTPRPGGGYAVGGLRSDEFIGRPEHGLLVLIDGWGRMADSCQHLIRDFDVTTGSVSWTDPGSPAILATGATAIDEPPDSVEVTLLETIVCEGRKVRRPHRSQRRAD